MITNGDDFAVFELPSDGIYLGHYEFKSRGRTALAVAKDFIDVFFEHTGEKALRGFTPIGNKKARWFTRQLGFTASGIYDTSVGTSELFILIRNK